MHPSLPAPSDAVQLALADYAAAARGAFAANTERAVRADTAIFAAWCTEAGLCAALPVSAATAAGFVDAMAATRKPATVRRYLASLNMLHRAAQLPPPGAAEIVRLAVRRMNVAKGTRQKQARGVTWAELGRVIAGLDSGGLVGARDAALLATGYDTMARISELAALTVADITYHEEGDGVALIGRSKTDQEGQGAFRFLSRTTCGLLRTWITKAGLEAMDDPLFVALSNRTRDKNRLRPRDIARVFQRRIGGAGTSGHSLRVGAAQDAITANLGFPAIQQAGGWASPRHADALWRAPDRQALGDRQTRGHPGAVRTDGTSG